MPISNQQLRSRFWGLLHRPILFVLITAGVVPQALSMAESHEAELVARVNGEAVTRAELRRVQADLLARNGNREEAENTPPDVEQFENLALRELIQRRLTLQEAARSKVSVSDKELDQALSALRGRFADLKEFSKWMKQRGMNDRLLLDTLRDDMLVARFLATLGDGVEVDEQQVLDHYASHREELVTGEEVRLRIIVVKSRTAARDILASLRTGENFSRLARKWSLGLRAAQGGDTGWVDSQALPSSLRRSVDMLKPGEASHPMQKGDDEFLIVGLEGRRPVMAKTLDEARQVIERKLLAAKRQEAVQVWLNEQEQKAKIEVFSQANDLYTTSVSSN